LHNENVAGGNFMRQIHWDAFEPSLAQALYAVAFLAVWTIVGMLLMKYFVRQVPLLSHAAILFWATLRVQIAVLAIVYLGSIFGLSVKSGLFGLLAFCAVGWLVTRSLSRKYGVPTKFPAVGAKVVTMMFIISSLIVVAIIVATGA
jgi:hypothetical protein